MHNERFNNGQQIQPQQQLEQIHLLQHQQHLQQAQHQLHQMQQQAQQQAQEQSEQQSAAPGSGRKKSRGGKGKASAEKATKKIVVETVSVEEALKALTLTPEGACSAIKTPVSVLQELLSRRGITPTYDLVQIEGAIHEPTFRYRVAFGDKDGKL